MKGESQMMLFRGRKLGALLKKLKKEGKQHVDLAEFAESMEELFTLSYKAFFRSQNIEELYTEELWRHVTSEDGPLRGELRQIHPLKHLASMNAAERKAALTAVLTSCVPRIVEKLSKSVEGAAKYKAAQPQDDSKYRGMVLGHVLCYDGGIDVLGLPSLDFEAAVQREHESEEKFKVDDVSAQFRPLLPNASRSDTCDAL